MRIKVILFALIAFAGVFGMAGATTHLASNEPSLCSRTRTDANARAVVINGRMEVVNVMEVVCVK